MFVSSPAARFVFSTPYTPGGKAHGDIHEQYMRKTILITAESFPYVKRRSRVVAAEKVNPIPVFLFPCWSHSCVSIPVSIPFPCWFYSCVPFPCWPNRFHSHVGHIPVSIPMLVPFRVSIPCFHSSIGPFLCFHSHVGPIPVFPFQC